MSTSSDPDAIRADIERTRAQLSYDVDSLTDTANPKNIAGRQVDRVKGAARGVKDRLMGSEDDPYDRGAVGDTRSALSDRASAVSDRASAAGDAVANAPRRVREQTQGNPLAAGLIAFGVGLLVSGLIPSSQREQRLVTDLQRQTEPLKEKATETAREVADNLRGPAQEAVESIKETAAQGAQNVKEEGVSAKEQVQSQAQDSAQTVQQERSS